METKDLIAEICDIFERAAAVHNKSREDVCWWNDKRANAIINEGVWLGYLYRMSVTQFHWTEKGVEVARKYL